MLGSYRPGGMYGVSYTQKISISGTPFTTCASKGLGANVDSAGMWDNIRDSSWKKYFNLYWT